MLKTKFSHFQSNLFSEQTPLAEVLHSKFVLGKIQENLSSLFCPNNPLAVLLLVLSTAVSTSLSADNEVAYKVASFQGKGSLQIPNSPKIWINNQTETQQLKCWGLLIITLTQDYL